MSEIVLVAALPGRRLGGEGRSAGPWRARRGREDLHPQHRPATALVGDRRETLEALRKFAGERLAGEAPPTRPAIGRAHSR